MGPQPGLPENQPPCSQRLRGTGRGVPREQSWDAGSWASALQRLHCLESFSSYQSCLVSLHLPQRSAVMLLMGPALFFFLPKLRSAC